MEDLLEGHRSRGEATSRVSVEDVFRLHYPALVRLAVLLGAADAEDVTAEAFVRLHARRLLLRDPDRAAAYLRSTVVNLCRSAHRRATVARRRQPPADPPAASAEQLAMLGEDHREVIAALNGLPPRQREALVLRYWAGLDDAAIAAAMGVSAGTVRAHVSKGLAALRHGLEGSPC